MTGATPLPPRNQLAALVRARRWTAAQFCAEYRAAAAKPGMDAVPVTASTIKRWLAGTLTSLPRPSAARVLEAMFGCTVEELFGPAPDQQRSSAVAIRHTAAGHDTRPTSGREPDGATERQVDMSTRRVREFLPLAEETNIGTEALDALTDELRRLARAYPVQPIPTLFPDLADFQDLAFRLLEGRQRPHQTRDLYFLAAAASALLASGCMDLGNPTAAIAHARAAYVCAENAGHPTLMAQVRVFQSMTAYWAGWTNDAATYAATGATLPAEGTVTAWLPALDARVQAARGDTESARRAIVRAEEARASSEPSDLDEIGGQLTFTSPRQLYYAADVLAWSPELAADAETASIAAIAAYESASPDQSSRQNLTLSRVDLAISYAHRHDLDAAAAALDPVLSLETADRTEPVREAIRRLRRAFTGPGQLSGPAQALTAELEHFARPQIAR